MKLSQAKAIKPIFDAWVAGIPIEYNVGSKEKPCWFVIEKEQLALDRPIDEYRIKPTPTLRPWKPEEAAIGNWNRNNSISAWPDNTTGDKAMADVRKQMNDEQKQSTTPLPNGGTITDGGFKPSPTPRTDAHAFHRITGLASPDGDVVDSDFARQLERELQNQYDYNVEQVATQARLERELDEAKAANMALTTCDDVLALAESLAKSQLKLAQLQKVAKELAYCLDSAWIECAWIEFPREEQALTTYNNLDPAIKGE
jgi:hypothetical protein